MEPLGFVGAIDVNRGVLRLRAQEGGVLTLQAPPEKIARLHPGELIKVGIRRGPDGLDYVVGIQKLEEEGGCYRFKGI